MLFHQSRRAKNHAYHPKVPTDERPSAFHAEQSLTNSLLDLRIWLESELSCHGSLWESACMPPSSPGTKECSKCELYTRVCHMQRSVRRQLVSPSTNLTDPPCVLLALVVGFLLPPDRAHVPTSRALADVPAVRVPIACGVFPYRQDQGLQIGYLVAFQKVRP